MKKVKLTLVAFTLGAAGLFAFKGFDTGSITGSVTPAEGVEKIWVLSSSDTLKADIKNGNFEIINVKGGSYRLFIEAKLPYKNVVKDNVKVVDGETTNIGQVVLTP